MSGLRSDGTDRRAISPPALPAGANLETTTGPFRGSKTEALGRQLANEDFTLETWIAPESCGSALRQPSAAHRRPAQHQEHRASDQMGSFPDLRAGALQRVPGVAPSATRGRPLHQIPAARPPNQEL